MPFGEKTDEESVKIDFDAIYEEIIRPAVLETGIDCVRCDEIPGAGSIHKDMFEHIFNADVAVVDISILNPNVFYELGIRHALNPFSTVIIANQRTKIPFNINGQKIIYYDDLDKDSYEATCGAITTFIERGMRDGNNDSPVFENLPRLNVTKGAKAISRLETIPFRMKRNLLKGSRSKNRILGIKTGNIINVTDVDVWVNTESTNMQMARFYDKRLSGIIRYLGAKKDEEEQVMEDTIANALSNKMKDDGVVEPGRIVVTTAGQLEETNNVKKVFHIATATGKDIGKGYTSISEETRKSCITNALKRVDRIEDLEAKSILFPLIGVSSDDEKPEEVVEALFESAIDFFLHHPDSEVEEVYFLAQTQAQLNFCLRLLEKTEELENPEEKKLKNLWKNFFG